MPARVGSSPSLIPTTAWDSPTSAIRWAAMATSALASSRSRSDPPLEPKRIDLEPQSSPTGSSPAAPGQGVDGQLCHRCVTHSRNREDTGGYERTRRRAKACTGGHWRTRRDTGGHDMRRVRDREAPGSNPGPPTILIPPWRSYLLDD